MAKTKKKTTVIAFCNYYNELNINNFMFDNDNAPIGDNLLLPFVQLKEMALAQNIRISTVDVVDPSIVDAFVFVDMPEHSNRYFRFALEHNKPLYLIILESRLTRTDNYVATNHALFDKIFTYNDDFVDNKKFYKLNYAFSFPSEISFDCKVREKLCVMIAGNKKSKDPNELYSKREEVIRWFEKNHPEDFDLYGIGWDKFTFNGAMPVRLLNRSTFLKKLFHKKYDSYKGEVDRKYPVLKQYKFSICYENICDVSGYITEKIFDSLICGCVPIYRGANNVNDHIPANCFIDQRDFNTPDELYHYISSMSSDDYIGFQRNIEAFFKSERSSQFTIKCFAETLLKEIAYE